MASHCPPGSVTASDVTQSLQDETQGISFQVLPALLMVVALHSSRRVDAAPWDALRAVCLKAAVTS